MSLIESKRVILCLGSGGVGKTTTSAAIALRAARQGKKAMVLTVDPAKRLANSLGIDGAQGEEHVVNLGGTEISDAGTTSGSLHAMMLDPKKIFDRFVREHARSEAARDRILNNRFYHYLSESLAGTGEYMAMEQLHRLRQDNRFDLIVVDTPPARNAIDFLEAPERLIQAVDSPAIKWFLQALDTAPGRGFLSQGTKLVLSTLSRFTGSEFLNAFAELLSALEEIFGDLRSRSEAVSAGLRSEEVAFMLVTTPEPSALAEAKALKAALTAMDFRLDGIVFNRMHQFTSTRNSGGTRNSTVTIDPLGDTESVAKTIRAQWPGAEENGLFVDQVLTAAHTHRQTAQTECKTMASFVESMPELVNISYVPRFIDEVYNLDALTRVGAELSC